MDAPREVQQIGPYRVERFIDEGAFAWVYLVVDPKFTGRRLALKVLKPEAAAGEEFRRFERESQLLAGMDHPSLVTIFDFGRDPATDCFYYTMTYVDGPTLKQRLREGSMSVTEVVELFIDLLGGLAHLHSHDVVHRDIKPANVLIGRDGRGRLSDLGIARVETERSQTRTGVAVGTALYMSPEQARGRPVDARSDLFSAGLTLYEALTGNVVYDHVDEIDSTSGMDVLIYIGRLDQQKDAEFKVVFPDEPAVPEPVEQVIRKACHLRVDQRYQTAVEMRDALRAAIHAPPPTASAHTGGFHWSWVAGAGGVFAVVAIAAFLYFLVMVPQRQEAEARAFFESVTALDERSLALADAAEDLEPPPPAKLLLAVEQRRERAAEYLFDGAEDISMGAYPSAKANLGRAQRAFEDACEQLGGGHLAERTEAERARLRERTSAMEADGAPTVAAEPWAALSASLPRLAGGGESLTGCDRAASQIELLALVPMVDAQADALESSMAEIWPKLAEEARQAALTARKLAETEAVEADEYRSAIKEGKLFHLKGDQKLASEDFRSARDDFGRSRDAFQTATAIIPAARARSATRTLATEVARGGQGIGGIIRVISKADAQYASALWEDSAATYRQALEELRGLRAEKAKRKAGLDARALAMAARESAVNDGALLSGTVEFEQADVRQNEAQAQLDARDFSDAEKGFTEALELFAAAQQQAIQTIAAARQRRVETDTLAGALTTEGACEALGTRVARDECAGAVAALAACDGALAKLDAPTALRSLADARDSFERARSAHALWEQTRPLPPTLVKRTPQRGTVEVAKNELRRFSIEASDPNGDTLRYTWSVGDEQLRAPGATLDHRLTESGSVQVRVDDGKGGELVESWDVVVANRPPTLEVSPTQRSLELTVGESIGLAAKAMDPDGDPVDVRFRLGGREVARGGVYTFRPDAPGTYNFEITASDSDGKQTVASRSVKVRARPAAAPPPRRTPTKAAAPAPTGLPRFSDWRGGVVSALERYESALESADMDQLEGVLIMGSNSPVRAFYARKFQRGEKIQVAIALKGGIEGGGNQASVDFDQTETSATRTRTYRYRATMIRRNSGTWQIEKRERRR